MILTRDNRTDIASLAIDESIMSTQNNYLGVRGNFEEGVPYQTTIRGTYVNGFYDTHTLLYSESAYGFPERGETIVNLPDAQTIKVWLGDSPLDLNFAKLLTLKRSYNMRDGYTTRSALYETMDGKQLWIRAKRLTHLSFKPLFMIDYTVESVNYTGEITIESQLNAAVENYSSVSDIRAGTHVTKRIKPLDVSVKEDRSELTIETLSTEFQCKVGLTHSVPFDYSADEEKIVATKTVLMAPKESFNFQKFALYYNTLDHSEMDTLLESGYNFVLNTSVDDIYAMQKAALDQFAPFADIQIETTNQDTYNEAIYFNLYQLYTAGAHSPRTNIPAKGLTGEGYEGHTFWDSEIYMSPFFRQVDQKLALNLLEYRFYQLDAARHEAYKLGNPEGVKFAWRTISGRETSAYYPASTAQYHINSDIAFAIIQYYKLYKDDTFMTHKGFVVLLETARFFKDLVSKHDNHYHIHHVTGPDEYNAVVDDNFYTNVLLKYHLEFLLDYTKIRDDLINDDERDLFQEIANKIYLPFDKPRNIDLQDVSFLSKKPIDLASIPEDNRPLLLHYHPLTIYRFQVLKQADTVLAHMLLHNRPEDVMQDSFDFYESRTSHDSSLSYCIHATQSAKLGNIEKAYDYFKKTIHLDLFDSQKNTFHGLHLANLGGVYMTLLQGFMGYEVNERVSIHPRLPEAWKRFSMRLRLNQDVTAKVQLTPEKLTIRADGDADIRVYGQDYTVNNLETLSIKRP